jgi:hypothetical protein
LLCLGWWNFFSSCAVASVFWLWREIVLGVTYLPYQLCRCVFFLVAAGNSFVLHRLLFWLWQEIVLGVTYLTFQLCRCVFFLVVAENSFRLHRSVFWLWWEIVLGVTHLTTMKARENIVELQKQSTTDKWNSYFICTSANLYVGIIYSFSTSAKQKAQLKNTWHNCKTNCTTAKKMNYGNFPLPSIPVVPLCLFLVAAGNSFWLHSF